MAVLHVWTQNYLQKVRTCPGRPLKLLTRNHFSKCERPESPPPPYMAQLTCLFAVNEMTLAINSFVHYLNLIILTGTRCVPSQS